MIKWKILRVLGVCLLFFGVGAIVLGSTVVLYTKGLAVFLNLFNPFNIGSFLVNIATVAPGYLLYKIADNKINTN